jgi:hypothetical protein
MSIANKKLTTTDCIKTASTILMRHGVDVNHHPVGDPKRKV